MFEGAIPPKSNDDHDRDGGVIVDNELFESVEERGEPLGSPERQGADRDGPAIGWGKDYY